MADGSNVMRDCTVCGTTLIGVFATTLGCPICRYSSPAPPPVIRPPDPQASSLAAAQALGRMFRRIGRTLTQARRRSPLCPVCWHLLRRCTCGEVDAPLASIDWFGDHAA